jgi:hypothetical protein
MNGFNEDFVNSFFSGGKSSYKAFINIWRWKSIKAEKTGSINKKIQIQTGNKRCFLLMKKHWNQNC